MVFESPQVPTMEQSPWQPGPMKTSGSTNVCRKLNSILTLYANVSLSLSLSLSLPPAPQFVSMYEIGEHIYVFFSEEAVEAEPNKVSF